MPGRQVNVIGRVIEKYAQRFGYGVVRDYTGHGVGEAFHSGLVIPHYDAAPMYDTVIEPGMVFTIEPMLTLGTHEWTMWDDGWTVADGRRQPHRAVRAHPSRDRHRSGDPDPAMSDHTTAHAFGIDIGGSGIKGAPVDLAAGVFAAERVRIPTPEESTPRNVAKVVAEVVRSFDLPADLPIGVTFPAVVQHGVARSAANVDKSWIGTNIEEVVGEAVGRRVRARSTTPTPPATPRPCTAPRAGRKGVVLVTTLGTGIGTAMVVDGVLVPNLELGHLEIDGHDAETQAADIRPGPRRPVLGAVGEASAAVLRRPGGPALARPHRRRRRGQQAPREVPAAAAPARPDRRRPAAQRRRHRRRGGARRAGRGRDGARAGLTAPGGRRAALRVTPWSAPGGPCRC